MRLKEEFRLFFMTFRSLPNVEANTKAPRLFLQPFPFAPSFCTHRSLSKHFGVAEQDRQEYVPPVRRHTVLFPRWMIKCYVLSSPWNLLALGASLFACFKRSPLPQRHFTCPLSHVCSLCLAYASSCFLY